MILNILLFCLVVVGLAIKLDNFQLCGFKYDKSVKRIVYTQYV